MADSAQPAIPRHIGFIVDGNRRWARAQGKNAQYGHQHGFENLKKIIKHCEDRGIEYVSAYIFSRENWQREEKEVSFLMNLAVNIVKNELDELDKRNVKLVHLGSRDKLSKRVLNAVDEGVKRTAQNTGMVLGLCFNYGGRYELVEAARQMLNSGLKADEITEEAVEKHLYGPGIPNVDFIVRTSGEHRLSNFMLWRAAYAEFYFPKTLWPDFDTDELDAALDEYAQRQRRYGA